MADGGGSNAVERSRLSAIATVAWSRSPSSCAIGGGRMLPQLLSGAVRFPKQERAEGKAPWAESGGGKAWDVLVGAEAKGAGRGAKPPSETKDSGGLKVGGRAAGAGTG